MQIINLARANKAFKFRKRQRQYKAKAMRTLAVFSFIINISLAKTHLSGNIGGMTFTPSGNPYLVSDNIIIEPNKKTVIKAGCAFLFKEFSGMRVDGELIVKGTLDSPVVFTSANDSLFSQHAQQLANPFDWNGILITEKATGVELSNFILAYSVYGIKSQKEKFSIINGTFKANGQFHVTVKDSIKPVVDGMPCARFIVTSVVLIPLAIAMDSE
jgi:hypothetical protein